MKEINQMKNPDEMNISELETLLRSAGKLFLDRKAASETKTKGVADYVTSVDFDVQQYIRAALEAKYPGVQFLSEEKENGDIDRNGSVWVLDPVDGTTNLIHDYHASVISLARMEGGEVVLGLIYDPYMDEPFMARKGGGSVCNGQPIHVGRELSMEECLIAIGTSPYYKALAEENFTLFRRIFMECQDIRRSGSAARDLAYVACGRMDGYLERNLKIWDYAAGALLVREAGGCVQDYHGQDIADAMISDVVAANPKVAALLQNIKR